MDSGLTPDRWRSSAKWLQTVTTLDALGNDKRSRSTPIPPRLGSACSTCSATPASLADVLAIFRLARDHNVPCWSSSSLRFDTGIAGVRNRPELGEIRGCDTHGPCSLEPHHPDLYWYGVHGVEALFTIMGPGCRVIQRVQTDDTEFVVGVWKDGRIGTYRGLRSGKKDFGALIYGTKGIVTAERESGYEGLVNEILKFFKTGKAPVSAEETIEIFAFMTAADESKRLGGRAVTLQSVIDKAKSQVQRVNTALK